MKADFLKLKDELVTSVNALMEAHQDQIEEQQAMNATTGINSAILQLLQQMQEQIKQGSANSNNRTDTAVLTILQQMQEQMKAGGTGTSTGKPTGRRTRQRKNTSKYCWSHGACSHESKDCTSPRKGHKWDATFENKMDGCKDFCKPCDGE